MNSAPRSELLFQLSVKHLMAANPAIVEAVEEVGLTYVSDASPGIERREKGGEFFYSNPQGELITDPETLDRIHKLAIPPAYRNVWISADPNGHLQGTGIDARGRKQYRYHPRFREVRDENKFHRMIEFGEALPKIRAQVSRDLARHKLSREKVLAVVVYLLERSLIRVGNEEYVKQNKSYGLTTMLTRHVKIEGDKIEFAFLGKSKTRHHIEIHDKRLARIVKRIQDLPGQELLHFLDDEGVAHSISSADVNHYLQEITGEHFTAKDFRTWWGTLLAFVELSCLEECSTTAAAKRAVSSAMKNVAGQLGNTPSICRKCYVHPCVVSSFTEHALDKCLSELGSEDSEEFVNPGERALLKFLKELEKN